MDKEVYRYKGVEYNSVESLAKASGVSALFLNITLDGTRSTERAIKDARNMWCTLDEICDDLRIEQEEKNLEFDRSLGY